MDSLFDPFGVPFADIKSEHLERLAEVEEGWFVDYKREPCTAKDYAKEASAFANSRGGWLFIGIEEDKKTKKPTGRGPGVAAANAVRLLDAARDSIRQHLSPMPYLDLAIVRGPIAALGVDAASAVLVIRVPQSEQTPHLHSSGAVYQRKADVCEPCPIANRAELDELYARHRVAKEQRSKALDRGFDPRWASEFTTPWVHSAFVPLNRRADSPLTRTAFEAAVRSKPAGALRLPDIYSTALGFVARDHGDQGDPSGAANSLEYADDGSLYVTVPLSSGRPSESLPFLNNSNGRRFCSLLRERNFAFKDVRVFDGTNLAAAMYGLGTYFDALIGSPATRPAYAARTTVRNVFRSIPFFNSDTYVTWCSTNTMPVMTRDASRIPWADDAWNVVSNAPNLALVEFHDVLASFGLEGEIAASVVSESLKSVPGWSDVLK